MKQLNYVFEVEYKSCSGEHWVRRADSRVTVPNNTEPPKDSKGHYLAGIAGHLAATRLRLEERGVRVFFLGLQEMDNSSAPITSIGDFVLTLERT